MFYELIVTVFTAVMVFLNLTQLRNYPKGPLSLPFVGVLPILAVAGEYGINAKLIEYGEKYGKIFSLNLASMRCVFLNSSKLIKEAYGRAATTGRPKLETLLALNSDRGIALHDGQGWKEHRKFTVTHLKEFGFGKKSLEPIIIQEGQELVKSLMPLVGKPVSFHNMFNIAVINVLWTITSGERFSHDDPKLLRLVKIISRFTCQSNNFWIFFFPRLCTSFPKLSGWRTCMGASHSLLNFIQEIVDVKRKTFVKGVRRHFIDVYFEELEIRKLDVQSSFSGKVGEENLVVTCRDLFFAGSETMSTTLSWMFLYLALNPEVQRKVQAEIENVIGTNLPTLDQRSSMPYTQAVIFESLRCSSVAPVGIARRVLEDIEVGGYIVPKDTLVFSNIYAAHHDPDVWADPYNFKPERFLSSDGTDIVKYNDLVVFSFGKRACPGEVLAKDQLFIFLTSILQRFVISLDPSEKRPTMDAKFAFTRAPLPHNLILQCRPNVCM